MNEEIPQKSLPFYLFLIEHLEREFNNKRILSYNAGRAEALPQWNRLTKNEREKYKEKAFHQSEFIRTTIENVFAMDRRMARKARDEIARKKAMVEKYLAEKISDSKNWKLSTIILGSVNIFAKSTTNCHPAELSLLKFNISNGILEDLNIHFSGTGLPIGLMKEAIHLAEDTHKIAPDEQRFGEFENIELDEAKQRVKNFLGSHNVLFSLSDTLNKYDDIEATAEVMKQIIGIDVAVDSLQKLLITLQLRNGQHSTDNLLEKFKKNEYENWSFGCMHHYRVDAPKYCTLARVKRWVYKLCCIVLPENEIKAGKHLPNPLDTNKPNNMIQSMLTLKGGENNITTSIADSDENAPSISSVVDIETMPTSSQNCREKFEEACLSLPIQRPFAVVAPYNIDKDEAELLPFDFDQLMIDEWLDETRSVEEREYTYTPFDLSDIM